MRNETGPGYLLQEHGPAPHLLPPGPTSQRILRIIIALQAGDQAKACEPLGAIRDPDPGVALPLPFSLLISPIVFLTFRTSAWSGWGWRDGSEHSLLSPGT